MFSWAMVFLIIQTIYNSINIQIIFEIITEFGSEAFYIIIIPPIYWCVNKKFGFRLFMVTTLAAYFSTVLKNLFKTPRPTENFNKEADGKYAFPSGHAHGSTTFWLYAMLYTRMKWIVILGTILVALVSISRVYLGVHHFGDVIGGIALGIGTVIVFIILDPWITRKAQKWSYREKLFYSTVLPILLIIPTIYYFKIDPRGVKLGAALLGITFGSVLETKYLNFSVESSIGIKVYRILLGLFLAYMAHFGLSMVLPFNVFTNIFTAFLGGFTVIFIAPWVFMKIEGREMRTR